MRFTSVETITAELDFDRSPGSIHGRSNPPPCREVRLVIHPLSSKQKASETVILRSLRQNAVHDLDDQYVESKMAALATLEDFPTSDWQRASLGPNPKRLREAKVPMNSPRRKHLRPLIIGLVGHLTLVAPKTALSDTQNLEYWNSYISTPELRQHWQSQTKEFFQWSRDWQTLTNKAEEELSKILQQEIRGLSDQPGIVLTPWGNLDQETNFLPRITSLSNHEGPPITDYGGNATHRTIPPFYRLAELLGLGTNRLDLEFVHIDPSLEKAPDLGYLVTTRARIEIITRFAETGLQESIEIQRLRIDSYIPFNHTEVVMGPDVPLRKYRITSPGWKFLTKEPLLWHQEQIGSRLPEQAGLVFPSLAQQAQQTDAVQALRKKAARKLGDLGTTVRSKLTTNLRDYLNRSGTVNLATFRTWETSTTAAPETHFWNHELSSPHKAIEIVEAASDTSSPLDLLRQIASKQTQVARNALINGLRMKLDGEARVRATEQYINLVLFQNCNL